MFKTRRSKSRRIFPNIFHPAICLASCRLWCFSALVNYNFDVFLDLKAINNFTVLRNVTEPLHESEGCVMIEIRNYLIIGN
jgi:hypothetical protein